MIGAGGKLQVFWSSGDAGDSAVALAADRPAARQRWMDAGRKAGAAIGREPDSPQIQSHNALAVFWSAIPLRLITPRGRAGLLATPKWLLYVTGGLAYGEIKTTGTMVGATLARIAVTSVGSNSTTLAGWTVGAGVEGKITQKWSTKLEYLYMDLGSFSSCPFTLVPAFAIGANVNSKFTDHILRAGINYQFGGPVVARY